MQNQDILFDLSTLPEPDRDLIVITYDSEIYSGVIFCGKHFHMKNENNIGMKTTAIYKWLYADQLLNFLKFQPMDADAQAKVKEQIRQENKAKRPQSVLDELVNALDQFVQDIKQHENSPLKH
jgi:hypothetical protein